jgi:[citrate (pro-3S)-lyase] ligase
VILSFVLYRVAPKPLHKPKENSEFGDEVSVIEKEIEYTKNCEAALFFFATPDDEKINLDEFEYKHSFGYALEHEWKEKPEAGFEYRKSLSENEEFMQKVYGDNQKCRDAVYSTFHPKEDEGAIVSNIISNGIYNINSDATSPCYNVINGHRLTTDTPDASKHKIYIYGQCTAFGAYVSDEFTVESYLQRTLNENFGDEFEVVNCGVDASSNQNTFTYIQNTALKKGDIVIFFAPINQTLSGVMENHKIEKFETSNLFNRPHDHGYWMFDKGAHINHNGNRVIAEFMHETLKDHLEKTAESKADSSARTAEDQAKKDELIVQNFKNANPSFEQYLKDLETHKIEGAEHKSIGSIVMNCNPFTLGHRYLIEQAYTQVDFLYIFVVEEDKSIFPFADRIKLVKAGTQDLKNIRVLPSGNGIISAQTLPEYFEKEANPNATVNPSMDLAIFGKCIAPALNITHRFAGEEPKDPVTRQYNKGMAENLPRFGIEFHVVPRKEVTGGVISASTVRKLLDAKDFETLKQYVPQTTLDYLKERFATSN